MLRFLTVATFVAALAPVAVGPVPVAAAASHPCVDTIVSFVYPRLTSDDQNHYTQADFQSGVQVIFNTMLGMQTRAMVVHYQGDPGNSIMMAEHRGDPVLVCLVSIPQRDEECNPATDLRGRVFMVYDYKQNATYSGMNSEHGCGGA